MAKITDYASLSAAVIDHTTRDDLGDSMDRFVQMAEQAMKRRLRSLDMEVTVTLALTAGEATLPADLLSIREIKADDLPLITHSAFAGGVEGTYRRSGTKLIVTPDTTEEVDLTYVAKFTPLATATTNWLIADHPDVYFYGTLAQAYGHYRDMDGLNVAEAAFRNALEEVATSRNRDRYGSGVIAPRLVTQVANGRC